jgi:LAGLIDADG endonuclease
MLRNIAQYSYRYLTTALRRRQSSPKGGGVKDSVSINKKVTQDNKSIESNLDGQLGYYLAGLIESDGAIITPSFAKANDGLTEIKKNTPTIKIVFQIKDKPLAEHIKTKLGHGSIQKTSSDSAIELVIRSKKGIIDLVSLINGKFRTPKIIKLNKLIN